MAPRRWCTSRPNVSASGLHMKNEKRAKALKFEIKENFLPPCLQLKLLACFSSVKAVCWDHLQQELRAEENGFTS